MKKHLLFSVAVLLMTCAVLALAGTGKKKISYEALPDESKPVTGGQLQYSVPPTPNITSLVGTSTSLSGFYDYQSNGGSIQQIRVNPANGNIHTTFMLADDSTAAGLNGARRVGYAFSSNGGTSWNNFSNVRVPSRRAGFPTIDLLQGANAGCPVIANHSTITGTNSTIFVDSPEGTGAFSEITAPPLIDAGGADEPIWPYIAGTTDGSVVMAGSRSTAATVHYTRTSDFTGWSPWTQMTGPTQSGGRYPVQSNGTGRVGILANTSNGTAALGNWWTESTNNGATWSAPVNLYPTRSAGADTFNSYVHADFVYNGNTPLFVFSEYITDARPDANIVFWSQASGFKIAVPWDSSKYFLDPVNQRFHGLQLGWPTIGMSGNTIVVAYQAFQPDTDRLAYHYSNLWYVSSNNGGSTWSAPVRITNTAQVDERYPSVSKWNASGRFDMVWTQKNASGLFAFPGGADTVRTTQMFLRTLLTDVNEGGGTVANSFKLTQNYPNPFNPATKIDYTVGEAGPVSIKVYNTLGQEVATILNERLERGSYQVVFDGAKLASGVYFYTMVASGYTESRKMVLMK
ncbi:MAG: T9SS type A sorting domain-containing protein [Ignavibacteriae bacterium]|nr:T9SS type A sorting domain-containing protein [Ignavibacteriota bacterium]